MSNTVRKIVGFWFLLCAPAFAADTPGQIPDDVRWRESLTRFLYRNTDDTTEWYYAFIDAATKWQPGNFRFEMTNDASNNQICKARPQNIRIVNLGLKDSNVCGKPFEPGTLAVTFVIWDNITRALVGADILFNRAYSWRIYDGPLRPEPDFKRVAVHELGHAGGLNHSAESSSIMLPDISNVTAPSANDTDHLRAKYVTELPPSPPPPFACAADSPYPLKSTVGVLQVPTYRLGGCLDGTNRPQTTFYFYIRGQSKRVVVGVGADKAELNVQLLRGSTVIWRGVNDGSLGKSSGPLDLSPDEYGLQVTPVSAGTTYNASFVPQ